MSVTTFQRVALVLTALGPALVVACSESSSSEPAPATDAAADVETPTQDATVDTASPQDAASDSAADSDAADAGADADADAAPAVQPNRIFTTSTSYDGNLGGLAGADAKCQARATAAGLTGTFKAFLSTSAVDADSRLAGARGWVRTDGKPFADTAKDFIDGKIYYPATVDENGAAVPPDLSGNIAIATGSDADGKKNAGATCMDWSTGANTSTLAFGYAGGSSTGWFALSGSDCSYSLGLHLLCVETARVAVVTKPPAGQYRRVFVSAPDFAPGGGIAAADAKCAAEATAANLPGTFKAFLGTNGTKASDRLNTGGLPWARLDDVVVANPPTAFAQMRLAAAIDVRTNGQRLPLFAVAWSGQYMPGTSATDPSSCVSWTSSSNMANGVYLLPGANTWNASGFDVRPCNQQASLICFQE